MIIATEVTKRYSNNDIVVNALDNASVTINDDEFVLIVGRSGSGKSTLLSVLGGLTRPTNGKVEFNGREIWSMNDSELSSLRSKEIGFVFQFPGLLPTLNAIENVMLPTMFSKNRDEAGKRAKELLESVGLGDKLRSFPHQLSGGELKRASIARALINNPSVILADEPTGDLDAETEQEIMTQFKEIGKQGKMIIMVTHNPDLSVFATKVLTMNKGKIS
ncbi:MAG TPA: ABC transporter ATP-binding protein [Methanomassiliicoccales archaeon]